MVADKYTALLSLYIHDSGGDGDAGSSTSSTRNNSDRKSVCEKCVKGYQLLDLPLGASEDEVKQKRVALAQVLHPDHTGGMSKRTRDTAEEQLKSINAACNQIFSCQCARSTN
jgi:preprotein translocase subunit Sec63